MCVSVALTLHVQQRSSVANRHEELRERARQLLEQARRDVARNSQPTSPVQVTRLLGLVCKLYRKHLPFISKGSSDRNIYLGGWSGFYVAPLDLSGYQFEHQQQTKHTSDKAFWSQSWAKSDMAKNLEKSLKKNKYKQSFILLFYTWI